MPSLLPLALAAQRHPGADLGQDNLLSSLMTTLIAPPPSNPDPRDGCPPNHDRFNLYLSILITIGLVLSYLPQHLKIIRRRSSEGLSPWYLFLGGVSSASTVFNLVVLQVPLVKCCREWDGFTCAENLLGIGQVLLQFLAFFLIIILFILYFPQHLKYEPLPSPPPSTVAGNTRHHPDRDLEDPQRDRYRYHIRVGGRGRGPHVLRGSAKKLTLQYKYGLFVLVFVTTYFIACASLATVFLSVPSLGKPSESDDGVGNSARLALAAVFGFVSTVMTMVQFAPQIWKTFVSKSVGSLSIPMMCIQTPGTLIFVWSLSLRSNTNWTTYISYLVAMTLQGVLLALSLWYAYGKRRGGPRARGGCEREGTEEEDELGGDGDEEEDRRQREDAPLLPRPSPERNRRFTITHMPPLPPVIQPSATRSSPPPQPQQRPLQGSEEPYEHQQPYHHRHSSLPVGLKRETQPAALSNTTEKRKTTVDRVPPAKKSLCPFLAMARGDSFDNMDDDEDPTLWVRHPNAILVKAPRPGAGPSGACPATEKKPTPPIESDALASDRARDVGLSGDGKAAPDEEGTQAAPAIVLSSTGAAGKPTSSRSPSPSTASCHDASTTQSGRSSPTFVSTKPGLIKQGLMQQSASSTPKSQSTQEGSAEQQQQSGGSSPTIVSIKQAPTQFSASLSSSYQARDASVYRDGVSRPVERECPQSIVASVAGVMAPTISSGMPLLCDPHGQDDPRDQSTGKSGVQAPAEVESAAPSEPTIREKTPFQDQDPPTDCVASRALIEEEALPGPLSKQEEVTKVAKSLQVSSKPDRSSVLPDAPRADVGDPPTDHRRSSTTSSRGRSQRGHRSRQPSAGSVGLVAAGSTRDARTKPAAVSSSSSESDRSSSLPGAPRDDASDQPTDRRRLNTAATRGRSQRRQPFRRPSAGTAGSVASGPSHDATTEAAGIPRLPAGRDRSSWLPPALRHDARRQRPQGRPPSSATSGNHPSPAGGRRNAESSSSTATASRGAAPAIDARAGYDGSGPSTGEGAAQATEERDARRIRPRKSGQGKRKGRKGGKRR